MNNITDELIKLGELKEKGFITQEEFDSEKAKLLNNNQNQENTRTIGQSYEGLSKARVSANEIPAGVKGWSWGAFLLSWVWAIGNKTWIGLLAIIPGINIIFAFILGVKGREWAWKNKEWDNLEHFNSVQKKWSQWGIGLFCFLLVLAIANIALGPKNASIDSNGKTDVENSNNQPFDFETTANALASAYDVNTVSADMKYKGKKFKVSGVISEISTDFMDSAVITMRGGVNEFIEPQFELEDTQKEAAGGLVTGQTITLICEGAGDIVKMPMSKKCVFYTGKPSNLSADTGLAGDAEAAADATAAAADAAAPAVATAAAPDATNNEIIEEGGAAEDAGIEAADAEARYEEQQRQQADLARIQAETEAAKAKKDALQAEKELLAEQRLQSQQQPQQAQRQQAQCPYSMAQPLSCASRGGQPAYCAWDFEACGNPVMRKQESKTSCDGKVSTDRNGGQLIVIGGCRALFVPQR